MKECSFWQTRHWLQKRKNHILINKWYEKENNIWLLNCLYKEKSTNRLVEKVIPTSLGTWAGEKKKGMIDVLAFS